MDLHPIETHYKGRRFRSRLEARWAVFFDALGIKWEYEHEGFRLPSGILYLPDFWLPSFEGGLFAEVKPDGADFSKAFELACATGKPVWLCEGTPDTRVYRVISRFKDDDCSDYVGIPNADQAEGENRMFAMPGYEDGDGRIPKQYWDCLGDTFLNAVRLARSARFEHGESI